MNWQDVDRQKLNDKIQQATATGRGVSVSPAWLLGVLLALDGVASSCCETPGCCVEHPYCSAMEARAALKGVLS